jgi:hypothetical protein
MVKSIEENKEDCEYYISTKNNKGEFLIYGSDSFKLSEIDFINLIKVCLIEARNKTIGRKILAVYKDSTNERKHITTARLKMIGVKDEEIPKPTKSRKPKIK